MHTGYIKLWRKFKETSFFKNSHCVHLAVYLLLECNHEQRKIIWNKKELFIERGQCVTGLPKLAFETGISIQSLRTCLHILSNTGFLTRTSTGKFSIISIDKYSQYQENSTGKLTGNQQAINRQSTTNKNDKNDKNDKNINTPDNPVDWENCKTPQQKLAAHYLKRFCPDIYNGTQVMVTAFFKRHGRALSDICNQCGGDIPLILKAFDLTVEYFNSKDLTWVPDTAAKHISDYIGKAKQKLSQEEPIYADKEF